MRAGRYGRCQSPLADIFMHFGGLPYWITKPDGFGLSYTLNFISRCRHVPANRDATMSSQMTGSIPIYGKKYSWIQV